MIGRSDFWRVFVDQKGCSFMSVLVMKSEKARTEWRQTLEKAYAGGKDVVIERHGEPIVTVVKYTKWKAHEKRLRELEMLLKIRTRVAEVEADPSLSLPWSELERQLAAAGVTSKRGQ
jgi:prevent-host-death family protein